MALNSSTSLNVLPLYLTHGCFRTPAGIFSITAFTISSILLVLPLCILVLYLGFQRWQQQGSRLTLSHSDLFTYHMVVIELINISGCILICCGVHAHILEMQWLGYNLFAINLSGRMFFHILTCVERYLAVVHPITYLKLRKAKGIRNITTGCVWLLNIAGTGFMSMADQVFMVIASLMFTCFALIVISFCSLSVLCVLIRPGPGKGGVGRQQVDQSKLRAFYTIIAILVVLLLHFGGNLLCYALSVSPLLRESAKCGVGVSGVWFSLPNCLVLPLLFLQRAGKLLCCKNNG